MSDKIEGVPQPGPELDLAKILEQGRSTMASLFALAREDVNVFAEIVMRDEETGMPIAQAPIHLRWHELANENKRLVIWSHTEAGKTNQLVIARTLWALGRNPNTRVAIVSNTREQASKIIGAIAKYIEDSRELHAVFPNLRKADPWRAHMLVVKRTTAAKDPSVQAFGVHGAITGARIDLLIMDDVLDYENCQTPRARADLWDWYHSSVASRITADGRVIVVGTAWHPEDLLHRLSEQTKVWASQKFPVLDVNNEPTWPERWPFDRVMAAREERGPLEFARTMMCEARDDSDARFKRQWIDMALKAGEDWPVIHSLNEEIIEEELKCYDAINRLGGQVRAFTGVDLAVQSHAAADKTAIVTILLMPNEDRRILNVESGRWSGPEIIQRILDTYNRYGSIVVVENNAAQDYIRQFTLDKASIPIIPYTTGRNKLHPEFGVESIAAEMAGDKWIIPNEGGQMIPEINHLVTEMLYYQPDAHTGDRLMAMWLAREGARMHTRKAKGVGVRIIGSDSKWVQ